MFKNLFKRKKDKKKTVKPKPVKKKQADKEYDNLTNLTNLLHERKPSVKDKVSTVYVEEIGHGRAKITIVIYEEIEGNEVSYDSSFLFKLEWMDNKEERENKVAAIWQKAYNL